jgi:hypothetical protein
LVLITANLKAWLFPVHGKLRIIRREEPWRDITPLAAKLGMEWQKNVLRHSAISYRIAETQNVNQVALESGNSAAIIFKHYREIVCPEEAELWWSIAPDRAA